MQVLTPGWRVESEANPEPDIHRRRTTWTSGWAPPWRSRPGTCGTSWTMEQPILSGPWEDTLRLEDVTSNYFILIITYRFYTTGRREREQIVFPWEWTWLTSRFPGGLLSRILWPSRSRQCWLSSDQRIILVFSVNIKFNKRILSLSHAFLLWCFRLIEIFWFLLIFLCWKKSK